MESSLPVLQLVVAGLTVAAAGLLGAAGLGKLVSPEASLRAIRSLIPAAPRWTARVLGGLEVSLAIAFLAVPGVWTAVGLSIAYVGLATFAAVARNRAEDCGCFGESSSPIGTSHVLVCGAGAVSAAGFVALPGPMPATAWVVAVVGGIGVALVAYGMIGPAARLSAELAEVAP